ncbi:MerR family transcriptional regulator [Lactobacillus sp. ESL0731]|uniref:MerR family transcriptional regulator n=1 Tax=unclassified Lactobacillus TaxID=2620435 RepID=UPI0023FA096B|nr:MULTISPECIES: MerR family transcriptional regulator [unclassified Lactobacillus]WEV50902.1 MerR family transcriptional regulator [Lactobacillus sp. ESL0700]WEV62033.1 MerR family transcriptional regulator [Lactobacillus sp. ESL0731]
MTKKYTIKDFSAMFSLAPSTLRYYEDEGLIKPHRLINQQRYYTDDDVNWMRFLLHLKNTGMSISDLKKYVAWRAQGEQTIPQRLQLLKQTRAKFLEQIKQQQHHLQILNDKIAWYEGKTNGKIADSENFSNYLKRLNHKK